MRTDGIKIKLDDTDKIRKFINVVRGFVSDVDLCTDRSVIDAKSILGIYTVDLSNNVYVKIHSDNTNELKQFDAAMEEFV